MRSTAFSIFLVGICIGLAVGMGALYIAFAIFVAFLAISSGVYVTLAVGVGVMWPLLTVAFVKYVALRTQELTRSASSTRGGAEAVLPGIEDAKHRERRDQA